MLAFTKVNNQNSFPKIQNPPLSYHFGRNRTEMLVMILIHYPSILPVSR
jgi:hypothetical protein